jgi:glucosamine-6-phosphate deaminase
MESFVLGQLEVRVHDRTEDMALDAAGHVAARIRTLLGTQAEVNMVVSGALSQQAFHHALTREPRVAWHRVNCYAVDEFWSPALNAAYSVAEQPRRDLYAVVNPKSVHVLRFDAPDPEAERQRYEALIIAHPPDIACLGIGRSGHIAFNEPGQTDFDDPRSVRVIDVVDESKRQLLADPNFSRLGVIPSKGITITISALMRCPAVYVVVPFSEKAPVIERLFELSEPATDFPASILRSKMGAVLFLDADSYRLAAHRKKGGE